jgi:hypothetical protein
MPSRIQRSRVKGWRMPEEAIYVGRPTKWGNPWRTAPAFESAGIRIPEITIESAVALHRQQMLARIAQWPSLKAELIAELRGHDLCCWCRLDQPCHADVLIELANG